VPQEEDALLGGPGLQLVDPGWHDGAEDPEVSLRLLDPSIFTPVSRGGPPGNGAQGLPRPEVACVGVVAEETLDEGRPAAEEAHDEQRPFDGDLAHLGVPAKELLGQELLRQNRDAFLTQKGPTEGRESGLRAGALEEATEKRVEADRHPPVVQTDRALRSPPQASRFEGLGREAEALQGVAPQIDEPRRQGKRHLVDRPPGTWQPSALQTSSVKDGRFFPIRRRIATPGGTISREVSRAAGHRCARAAGSGASPSKSSPRSARPLRSGPTAPPAMMAVGLKPGSSPQSSRWGRQGQTRPGR
jgi:hypothetical protein